MSPAIFLTNSPTTSNKMNLQITRRLWIGSVFASAMCLLSQSHSAFAATDERVFELRTYVTNEGKLTDLLNRFRNHTCQLFEKHGMENIGYWVPIEAADGADNTLIYVIAHKSRAEAPKSWAAFGKDPDWQIARQASEFNGKILAKPPTSIFLSATDYSPLIQPSKDASERVFELRTYTTPEGKLSALNSRFRDHTLKLFTRHGMTHIGYWTPAPDKEPADSRTLIYILSHPSKEAGLKSFETFRADPEWIAAKAASETNGALTLPQPEGVKSMYLRATDFSPIR